MPDITEQIMALTASFTDGERRRVTDGEMEALGYARGRMDAIEDHVMPRIPGLDPIAFAQSFALHVATGIDRYRAGQGATIRAIRDHWEATIVG